MAAQSKAAKKQEEQLPAQSSFMFADAGAGMEETDGDTFAIPFLSILQKSSPQVDEADGQYVEGARPGMFFNSVSQDFYDGKEGLVFLQCAFQRRFIHWGPRGKDEGGYKGEFAPEFVHEKESNGELVALNGKLYVPLDDGSVDPERCSYYADMRNHYGLIVHGDSITQVLLALGSTQIKKSRQIMSMLNGVKLRGPNGLVTPPTWGSRLILQTVPESNDKGSWHGVKAKLDGFVSDENLYNMAKEFHEAITTGKTRAAYESMGDGESSDDGKF